MSDGSAVFWMVCSGIFFIGLGLVSLAAPDLMWEWTAWNNQWKGIRSERTESWDTGRVIGAIISILVGAGIMCWIVTLSSQRAQEEAEREQREADIVSIANALSAQIDTDFADLIAKWQADDSPGVHAAAREDIRGLAQAVYYGRCDSSFYAFVIGYQGEDYAYVPQASPENCKPFGLQFGFFQSVIPISDTWSRVSISSGANDIITRTPRPGTPTATATATPNAIAAQATINAAIEQQVTAAVATQAAAVTQTIDAAVQMTLAAATTTSDD
jgi:hypothetical protein